MCAFVHPCWQTRVGGLQRKLFLTFLRRFAGSIVSDIMLFRGHNARLIERWPTACCDPFPHTAPYFFCSELRNCDQLGRQPIGGHDFNYWLEIALKKIRYWIPNLHSEWGLWTACGSHNNVNEGQVFWVLTPCGLVYSIRRFGGACFLLIQSTPRRVYYHEDSGCIFLWNVGFYESEHRASWTKTLNLHRRRFYFHCDRTFREV